MTYDPPYVHAPAQVFLQDAAEAMFVTIVFAASAIDSHQTHLLRYLLQH